MSDRLQVVPVTFKEAQAFVDQHHRHRLRVRGHLFVVGAAAGDAIVGVAIVGRPVARGLQDGFTVEVARCCTDGTRNACSMLYAAAWRTARGMGYRRLVTYTLANEPGSSLRGAGLREVARVEPRSWHTATRPRVDLYPLQTKIRWEVTA